MAPPPTRLHAGLGEGALISLIAVSPESPKNSDLAASDAGYRWGLAIFACFIGALPLLLTDLAPLQDWPSHLARIQILDEMTRGPSAWSRFYDFNGFLVPNAILDLLMLPALRLGVDIYVAAQLFLVVLYLVFIAGFCRLAVACGAMSPLKLVFASLLFFNSAFYYGLVNFEFGLGLLMFALGKWLYGTPRVQFLTAIVGTLAIFPCHLVAAFLFVFVIGCFDFYNVCQTRGRSIRTSSSLAGVAVALLLMSVSPTAHDHLTAMWGNGGGWSDLVRWKASMFVKALVGRTLSSNGAYVIGGGLLAIVIVTRFRISVSKSIAFAAAGTLLLALVAPQRLGNGSLLDYRIAIVPWLILAAGTRLAPIGRLSKPMVLLCALAIVLVRSLALSAAGKAADEQYALLDRSFTALPKDSVLLSGLARPLTQVSWSEFWTVSGSAIASLASRHGVFVPSIFADAVQQPLALKDVYKPWNGYIDVSSPELLAYERQRALGLCAAFPAGVRMLVLYPTASPPTGMERIGQNFGLLNMCAASKP